ncbi:Fructose-2,6-bisphosphatase [Podila epigama]|nr:Fructose-2,6-bisphosphatase [Podila epigama]
MRRTIATAEHLTYPKLAWKALDELDAGVCDGMTYEEIEPVIMDLERQRNILIIGHQAILRCIYAYFMNHSHEQLPYIKIPLHTVIQLTPRAYTCEEKRFKVDIEAVDTHRPKPKAGAPKSAAEIPLTEMPEVPANAEKSATITTTTMSTTTFKDGAIQARNKSISSSSTAAKAATTTTTTTPETSAAVVSAAATKATAEKAKDIQVVQEPAVAHPTGAVSNSEEIKPSTTVNGKESSIEGKGISLESVATPPQSPVPTVAVESSPVQEAALDLTPACEEEQHQQQQQQQGKKMHPMDDESVEEVVVPGMTTTASSKTPASLATSVLSKETNMSGKGEGGGGGRGKGDVGVVVVSPTPEESLANLSIKTKNLKQPQMPVATTPPSLLRDLLSQNPTAVWQEGHEYELTAGGSPRDPVISPGGRLLAKKENWHFP